METVGLDSENDSPDSAVELDDNGESTRKAREDGVDGGADPCSEMSNEMVRSKLVAELNHLRNRYENAFTPARLEAEYTLSIEHRRNCSAIEAAKPPVKGRIVFWAALVFLLIGIILTIPGRESADVMASAGIFLSVGVILALITIWQKYGAPDAKQVLEQRSMNELNASKQRWDEEDEKFRQRIRQLSDQVAELG